MNVWIAFRRCYADAEVVGIASSKAEAEDLVRAAYWRDYPGADRTWDPLDDYSTGSVSGPFTLGELVPE